MLSPDEVLEQIQHAGSVNVLGFLWVTPKNNMIL